MMILKKEELTKDNSEQEHLKKYNFEADDQKKDNSGKEKPEQTHF